MGEPENPPNSDLFGQIAIAKGFVDSQQVAEALRKQEALRDQGVTARIGRRLELLDHITREQVDEVLREQRRRRLEKAKKKVPTDRFGDYKLIDHVGEGSMGPVYKANDLINDRPVALKVLRTKAGKIKKEDTQRFTREIGAAAKLDHPNIVATYNQGVVKGVQFIAMEYLEAESLKTRIAHEGRIPEEDVLKIALGIAKGLSHAHSKGLVHRDVKPENILMGLDGSVKLSDFGRVKSFFGDIQLTRTGQIIGTPYYISPELAQGEKVVGPAADLYGLGATLYHALTGRLPFEAATPTAVMLRHISAEVPNPKDLNPELSDHIVQVVAKLMGKKPDDRYASADLLIEDLQSVLNGFAPKHAAADLSRSAILPRDPKLMAALKKGQRPKGKKGCLPLLLLPVLLALWWTF